MVTGLGEEDGGLLVMLKRTENDTVIWIIAAPTGGVGVLRACNGRC